MSDAERYATDDGEPEETFEDAEMEEEPDYGDGEPESGSPEASSDAFPSDEEDELVDEMEDAAPMETNRRTRRPALRVKLSRRSASDTTPNTTPSRRTSGRKTQRTARALGEDGEEDESDEIDEDSDLAESAGDAPMTARQMARANRERGITNDDLVELPMGTSLRLRRRDQAPKAYRHRARPASLRDGTPPEEPERKEARGRQDRGTLPRSPRPSIAC